MATIYVQKLIDRLARFTTRRLAAIGILIVFLAGVGAVMGAAAGGTGDRGAPDPVPAGADSAEVSDILAEFPGGDQLPAVLVGARDDGKLSAADRGAIKEVATAWAELTGTEPVGPVPSEDGQAELYVVPLPSDASSEDRNDLVNDMRDATDEIPGGLPDGVSVELTGAAGFSTDISSAFSGANVKLLIVTGSVVALLLILTYRSPVLWLVPLLVIAIADRTATVALELISKETGNWLDGSTSGITSVLVFGAGTNYALLLISRYREELHLHDDHRDALRAAQRGAVPAIVASNLTVVLALATLLFSVVPSGRALGIAAGFGLLLALAFSLLCLPAALSLCGRRLFWPFIPRHDREPVDPAATGDESGAWFRIARWVVGRPVPILLASTAVLLVLASGLFGAKIGLSQTDQFEVEAESVDGLTTLSQHFPAGAADPVTVVTRAEAANDVLAVVKENPGVASARPAGQSDTGWVKITADLKSEPSSERSMETIRELRDDVSEVPGGDALVGGSAAQQLDSEDGAMRDLMVVVPLILLVVLIVLLVVLGSVVAPLVLLGINLVSTAAALGLGVWVSDHLFGFPALDVNTPLFVVLFLVALGIDYTVFLVLRAKEETPGRGTRAGIIRSVGLTGSVITSAGVVLAAVFVVLATLPLVTLTQVGVIVGLGVLIDTFLVRSIVLPAVFALLGSRIWALPLPGYPRVDGGTASEPRVKEPVG